MIKFSKDLEWLAPYIYSIKGLVPVGRITGLSSFTVPLDRAEKTAGSIHEDTKKKTYNITLNITDRTYKNTNGNKFKLEKQGYCNISYILETLAHELAHIKHWEHTPEHFLLQSKILVRFAKVAKDLEVKDLSKKVNPEQI